MLSGAWIACSLASTSSTVFRGGTIFAIGITAIGANGRVATIVGVALLFRLAALIFLSHPEVLGGEFFFQHDELEYHQIAWTLAETGEYSLDTRWSCNDSQVSRSGRAGSTPLQNSQAVTSRGDRICDALFCATGTGTGGHRLADL